VPPAYTDVRYAEDSSAHLKAVGTDAAGRLQYRYHEELANTPTVCRKTYVHEAVVIAFEQGALARLRKPTRSPIRKAEVLARIVVRNDS
jgi:DNA topoisomerase IB